MAMKMVTAAITQICRSSLRRRKKKMTRSRQKKSKRKKVSQNKKKIKVRRLLQVRELWV